MSSLFIFYEKDGLFFISLNFTVLCFLKETILFRGCVCVCVCVCVTERERQHERSPTQLLKHLAEFHEIQCDCYVIGERS
jgi:hypothetical protein